VLLVFFLLVSIFNNYIYLHVYIGIRYYLQNILAIIVRIEQMFYICRLSYLLVIHGDVIGHFNIFESFTTLLSPFFINTFYMHPHAFIIYNIMYCASSLFIMCYMYSHSFNMYNLVYYTPLLIINSKHCMSTYELFKTFTHFIIILNIICPLILMHPFIRAN
jgi:hypothetical protein